MMIWKTVALLTLALCVQGRKIPMDDKWHDDGQHRKIVHIGSHEIKHHEGYAPAYPKYEFSYSVDDPHTHDQKAQWEKRDGDEVKGEYWLVQPDGKKRTVTYQADKHSGFQAHVEYSRHHHPVEEVIIPIVEIKEEEPHHDLIQKEEEDKKEEKENNSSEEQPEIVKEEEKQEKEEEKREEEKKDEEKELPVHPRPIQYEYHSYIEHPLPIYKKHKPEHHEPMRHSPEVHEKPEEEEEDKRPNQNEQVDRIYRVSHHGPKIPILRYTKVGASNHLGHMKPIIVDTLTGVDRRYDLDRPRPGPVELSRLHRRPVPQYLRSRQYRDDSKQKNVQHTKQ